MAKLDMNVSSYVDSNFNREFFRRMLDGEFDDYEGGSRYQMESGMISKNIVETYLKTGAYANIDCPGGIEQMVKDYYDGKFDD